MIFDYLTRTGGSKRVMLLKVIPNFWFLFRLMDGLRSDARQRYWIRECSAEEDIGDIREELGQEGMEVKIAFPMSHNV